MHCSSLYSFLKALVGFISYWKIIRYFRKIGFWILSKGIFIMFGLLYITRVFLRLSFISQLFFTLVFRDQNYIFLFCSCFISRIVLSFYIFVVDVVEDHLVLVFSLCFMLTSCYFLMYFFIVYSNEKLRLKGRIKVSFSSIR